MSNHQKARAEIKAAAEQFYQALNALFYGHVAPMLEVWSHAEDVAYMGPQGEIFVGWRTLEKMWQEQAGLLLKGKIEPLEMHVIVADNLGITYNYEAGNNEVNGQPFPVRIRASNIFRKEAASWKMIGHQTDRLSFFGN